ncbi:MAG TPA: tetratricopeptide repeat protein [Pirellulales bacterium]|nr:tetratricopeptide repeat protein [Pirellulales bacterium]
MNGLVEMPSGGTAPSSPGIGEITPRRQRRRHRLADALLRCLVLGCLFGGAGWSWWCWQSPEHRAARALSAGDANDFETIRYQLLGLQAMPAVEAEANLLSGKLLLARNDPERALYDFAVAATKPAIQPRALVLTGACLYQTGHLLEAGKDWAAAIKLDSQNADAYRWLGVAYYDLGAVELARDALKKAAELAPDDPGPHRLIGLICTDNADPQGAVAAYREALRRAPERDDNDEIRLRLADVLHRVHQEVEALNVLAECPSSPEVLAYRAECEFSLGNDAPAWQMLEQSLREDEELVRALGLKGKMLLKNRQYAAAVQSLETAFKLAPKDAAILYDLQIAYQRTNQRDKVAEFERRLKEIDRLEAEYGALTDEARRDLQDSQLRYRLGMAAVRLEKFPLAKKWFEVALGLDPTNADARSALNRIKWPAQMKARY